MREDKKRMGENGGWRRKIGGDRGWRRVKSMRKEEEQGHNYSTNVYRDRHNKRERDTHTHSHTHTHSLSPPSLSPDSRRLSRERHPPSWHPVLFHTRSHSTSCTHSKKTTTGKKTRKKTRKKRVLIRECRGRWTVRCCLGPALLLGVGRSRTSRVV